MNLWKIAWRSIQQRTLASSLTGISLALGVMLVVAVLVIHGVINQSFMNNSGLGYNVVVGAKGGRMELVLNTVYYLGRPVENIPYTYYLDFTEGKYKGSVQKAIPICLGDSFQNFRVVGTTHEFFRDLDYGGKKYEFADGRNFEPDEYTGAVIGAAVARETGLKKGDTFVPSHGTSETADKHEHDPFTVLGVLKPTGTPNDRALFVNMEGFFLIEGHAKEVDKETDGHASDKHDGDERPDHKHDEMDEAHKHEHPDKPHTHEDGEKPPAATSEEPGSAAEPAATDEHPEGKHEHGEEKHEHSEGAGKEDSHKHEHAEESHKNDHHDHGEHGHEVHDHAGHDHAGHDHSGYAHVHKPLPISQREVTAILILTASVPTGFTDEHGNPVMTPPEALAPGLIKTINKRPLAQAVQPIREMATLFDMFVNPLRVILLSLTVMIVIVSGISILVSIYNSMNERQHEIAVIRALGAGRRKVMLLVLLESILLSVAGGMLGWVVGHLLIAALSPWITQQTGVTIGLLQFVGYELVIIPALIVLAALVGYLPAMAAYRTDVAKALSATP